MKTTNVGPQKGTRVLNRTLRIAAALIAVLTPMIAHAQINIPMVTIGNPGNAADSTGYGAVSYTYDIGTYEVSLLEYTAFLNAVASTDPYQLWSPYMQYGGLNSDGISQMGSSGSYTYSVIGDGNRPVTYVSWFDAARFTNWLDNGQPSGLGEVAGSTETGAYTLNGVSSGLAITKNPGATWYIPSEDEWYKAAYYDPTLNGGTGGYWLYPTQSNSAPGNVVSGAPNQANYYNGVVFSTTQNDVYNYLDVYTTPGGAYSGSASYYGTFDQGGNVWEWNDAIGGTVYPLNEERGMRGGSWFTGEGAGQSTADQLQSSYRLLNGGDAEDTDLGFRVVSVAGIEAVPEPGTAWVGIAVLLAAFVWRRRARSVRA